MFGNLLRDEYFSKNLFISVVNILMSFCLSDVLLIFIFAHILYFYAFSAIMPVSISWQGHLAAFLVGAAIALVSQKKV